MGRATLLSLGFDVARRGGRAGMARLLLMTAGLCVGATLILGAFGVNQAIDARHRREIARTGEEGEGLRGDVTLIWPLGTTFRGERVLSIAVMSRGDGPVPAGIPRIPSPGEAFVSPSLGALLETPAGALLRRRVPGKVVGVIGDEGLLYPGEMIGYVSPPASVQGRVSDAVPIANFTKIRSTKGTVDTTRLALLSVLGLAFLAPIALFLLIVIRVGSMARERTWAAMRLVGATRVQIRLIAAVEVGLAAFGGSLLALPFFLWISPLFELIPITDYRWFSSDVRPTISSALLVVAGLPILSVLVTVSSLRKVNMSPLGVVRPVSRRPRTTVPLVVLMSGLASLLAVGLRPNSIELNALLLAMLVLGIAGVLGGALAVAPGVAWQAARRVAAAGPRPSVLLGARRLQLEPRETTRMVGGIALLVTLVSLVQTVALTSGSEDMSGNEPLDLATTDVLAVAHGREGMLSRLGSVHGVLAVRPTRRLSDGSVCAKPCAAILSTDGDPATVERVRNKLAWTGSAETTSEMRSSAAKTNALSVVGLTELAILLIFIVTSAGLLVSVVESLAERKRPFAILSAVGVPIGVLRGAVMVQAAFPLIAGIVVGGTAGLLSSWMLLRALSEPTVLPIAATLRIGAAAVAVGLAVSLAATPWLSSLRRPEYLRRE
jgi:hypothetical protein